MALFTFVIYYSAFSHNFFPDDWYLLGIYQKFDFFREFVIAYFGGAFSLPLVINGFYRPINSIFYYFGYNFFGVNPTGYRVIVFIFFILCSFLVFKLSDHFFNDQYVSFLASVIYISRSVHDLSLLAPSGIVNVCSDFFMLSSIYMFIHFKDTGKIQFFILSVCASIGAFFSKEGSVILFLLILLIEIFYSKPIKINLKESFKKLFPFFLIFLLYLIRVFFFRSNMISEGPYSMSFTIPVLINNFLFFVRALFNNSLEIALTLIFLGLLILSRVNIRDYFNKNFLFIGIFLIGLFPYLFLKTQLSTYYSGFSAVGFSAIFAYILLSTTNNIIYKKCLLLIFIVMFIFSGFWAFHSYQDINNPINAYTFQEQKINNVLNYLKQTDLPQNSTIVFINSNLYLNAALGSGTAVELSFKNVSNVYFDNAPQPSDNMIEVKNNSVSPMNLTTGSNVFYFKYSDPYQNISRIYYTQIF